jgi:hypothetical protein
MVVLSRYPRATAYSAYGPNAEPRERTKRTSLQERLHDLIGQAVPPFLEGRKLHSGDF